MGFVSLAIMGIGDGMLAVPACGAGAGLESGDVIGTVGDDLKGGIMVASRDRDAVGFGGA
jgi:hypothetical protein